MCVCERESGGRVRVSVRLSVCVCEWLVKGVLARGAQRRLRALSPPLAQNGAPPNGIGCVRVHVRQLVRTSTPTSVRLPAAAVYPIAQHLILCVLLV